MSSSDSSFTHLFFICKVSDFYMHLGCLSLNFPTDHHFYYCLPENLYLMMIVECKYCGSSLTIKYGKSHGKRQTYLCKSCGRRFVFACKYCGSVNIVRRGYRSNKSGKVQRFQCRDCGRQFVFTRNRLESQLIALCIKLHSKGFSYRKIADYLKQFHDIEISHVTIFKWIEKLKVGKLDVSIPPDILDSLALLIFKYGYKRVSEFLEYADQIIRFVEVAGGFDRLIAIVSEVYLIDRVYEFVVDKLMCKGKVSIVEIMEYAYNQDITRLDYRHYRRIKKIVERSKIFLKRVQRVFGRKLNREIINGEVYYVLDTKGKNGRNVIW